MNKSIFSGAVSVAAVFFILSLVSPCFAEEVKIGAGAAPTENVFKKIMVPMEKAIGVKVILVSNGPSEALKDLDKNAVDAASGGVTFPDWMAMMDKEGYQIPDKSAYKHRVIGKDLVKVLTNKDVTVKQLSKDQLKGVFTGSVKNWKEVGGPDKPVVVLLGTKIPGTQSVFQKQVMDGGEYTKVAKEGTTAEDLKAKAAATSGAVCLGPASIVDSSVNAPEIPEIGRPITLITKGEPSPSIVKMLEYIRGEGKKYIDN
ncbi:MAG: substrate-binding domain-containing protein [Deltaproteobacteria bacterium]|nr:substrate-binding domain-containing protein [Deltaproteobacteria bacterium]